MVADLAQKPEARHQGAAVVGEAVGGVELFHLPDQAVDQALAAAAVGNGQTGRGAQQGGKVHVGRAADQLNAELIRLADLLKARESVHAEVAALGGEVEPGGVGGRRLGHGNSQSGVNFMSKYRIVYR